MGQAPHSNSQVSCSYQHLFFSTLIQSVIVGPDFYPSLYFQIFFPFPPFIIRNRIYMYEHQYYSWILFMLSSGRQFDVQPMVHHFKDVCIYKISKGETFQSRRDIPFPHIESNEWIDKMGGGFRGSQQEHRKLRAHLCSLADFSSLCTKSQLVIRGQDPRELWQVYCRRRKNIES